MVKFKNTLDNLTSHIINVVLVWTSGQFLCMISKGFFTLVIPWFCGFRGMGVRGHGKNRLWMQKYVKSKVKGFAMDAVPDHVWSIAGGMEVT